MAAALVVPAATRWGSYSRVSALHCPTMPPAPHARVHGAFVTFLIFAFLGLPVALGFAGMAADACDGLGPGSSTDPIRCTREGESYQTIAVVMALGSLTTALIGVGFQVGREGVRSAPPMMPYGGMPVPMPPPHPGQRGQPRPGPASTRHRPSPPLGLRSWW
jgi:hypothetical protein